MTPGHKDPGMGLLAILRVTRDFRKTALRKPNRGDGIVSTKARPKSVYDFWFSVLFHCFIMCLSCPPALCDVFHTPRSRYSLFVLKMLSNTNQLTNLP